MQAAVSGQYFLEKGLRFASVSSSECWKQASLMWYC